MIKKQLFKKLLSKLCSPYTIIILMLMALFAYQDAKQQGFDEGFEAASTAALKSKDKAVARAIKETNQVNQENAQFAQEHWANELAKKPKIQTIEKRIIEYVATTDPNHCPLDDSELHILQELTSIANRSAGDPTEADRPIPATTLPKATDPNRKRQTAPPAVEKSRHTAVRPLQGKT